MWTLAYNVVRDFGALGLNVVQFAVVVWLLYKIMNNHLKHLKDQLTDNSKEIGCIKTEVVGLKERVAHLEGKLE